MQEIAHKGTANGLFGAASGVIPLGPNGSEPGPYLDKGPAYYRAPAGYDYNVGTKISQNIPKALAEILLSTVHDYSARSICRR